MTQSHYAHWPARMPVSISVPDTTLTDNLEVSARRYPDKTAIIYYNNSISYRTLWKEVNLMAAYLLHLGVEQGDRVLLYMQNSPQYIISYYAIMRSGAIVVPINPMNLTEELAYLIEDSVARVGFVSQELYSRIEPLLSDRCLERIIVATYTDYCSNIGEEVPNIVRAPRLESISPQAVYWTEAMKVAAVHRVSFPTTEGSDLAVLPYTSGTTGKPKGCMHTHKSVQANVISSAYWGGLTPESKGLATLPFFHVIGMIHGMHVPIFVGAAMVIMTRWDRNTAALLMERHKCTYWTGISTMIIDFLANPELSQYDLRSLMLINGGGTGLPEVVGEKLYQATGLRFVEGYGLSETMAQTHCNPLDRPKLQCLGIPAFGVDSRVIDPMTLEVKGPGEEGEIIIDGPQLFKGYWNDSEATRDAFVKVEGKSFFRTGDIGRYDEDGYFFIVDRMKRMINASGFKVWPTEVETILYRHPAIQEVCVIGIPDERKGEEIKAYIVLREGDRGKVSEGDIIRWAQEHMAAYKYPRVVEFVASLPVTGSGKILWRKLQEEAWKKAGEKSSSR
ncbi:long-chain fatty acid--CoA ligase [Paenibacillus alvei]|uniref:long-chain fatty acid--CoA ligase n=1 Tax=Paenibacillus alvei TaxID=44250 RepID=UPI0018CFA0EE|nr:long-chain fatty acid--CoA ligase [Paenibacillus alvei]MBG9733814.1 long-chain fatty acid--CoA ligase [Paenibacillus alvei]MBG9743867.1 long-chain fatty acid--CoA ligase [Paenibacillus alvei]MCY9580340.1 long-chain fatty acid--CoA ligase [Paenibacillus alvei]MCY9583334.1 long-chain fatty acid--CoA ligase [Paenibacillus alvei]